MPAYVVGDVHITDPAAFRAHVPAPLATIARHGGWVVAGGNKIELLEGEPMAERIVIIIRVPRRRSRPPLVPLRRVPSRA